MFAFSLDELGKLTFTSVFLVSGTSGNDVSETKFGFLKKENKLCWVIIYELILICLAFTF